MRYGAFVVMCALAVGLAACGEADDPRTAGNPAQTTASPEPGEVSGGLVDAVTEPSSSDTGEERFEEQAAEALARTEANPKDAAAWRDLIRARIQIATSGDRYDPSTGEYTAEGKRDLREAVSAWNEYVELDDPDGGERSGVAARIVQAFIALGDYAQAAGAQEIVAGERDSVGAYSQLALLAYQAGQARKGDLAAAKAIELAPEDEREALRGQLETAKLQVSPP